MRDHTSPCVGIRFGSSENSNFFQPFRFYEGGRHILCLFPDMLRLGLQSMTQLLGRFMDFRAEPGVRAQIAGFGVVPTALPQGDTEFDCTHSSWNPGCSRLHRRPKAELPQKVRCRTNRATLSPVRGRSWNRLLANVGCESPGNSSDEVILE